MEMVMKGCSHQKPRYNQTNTTKIVAYIIKKFNGEII